MKKEKKRTGNKEERTAEEGKSPRHRDASAADRPLSLRPQKNCTPATSREKQKDQRGREVIVLKWREPKRGKGSRGRRGMIQKETSAR